MKVVIIGNGLAGVNAAKIISGKELSIDIEIYSEESYHFYQRPWLIDFLGAQREQDDLFVYPQNWYQERNIKIHLNTKVEQIDPFSNCIYLQGKTKVRYHKLLLATGSNPFLPPIKNLDKKGVFSLRNLDDAISIKDYSKNHQQVIVIGGGLLGLESARSLRNLCSDVCVVEFFPRLLPRQLDQEGAEILKMEIEKMGIDILLSRSSQEILGEDEVVGVKFKGEEVIEGSLVLLSSGISPRIELAKGAGIEVDKGIVVNEYMQTNFNDIYAVGDVAQFEGKIYGIIPACLEQSKIAAYNLMENGSARYNGTVPSTSLKVVGIDLTSIGYVIPEGKEKEECQQIRRADAEKCIYRKIVVKDNKIIGAILLNSKKLVGPLSNLITQKIDISSYANQLLDDDFDFKEIPT